MKELLTFLQNILMIRETAPHSIGLSQFKEIPVPVVAEEKSIRNKDIKLSDLMRRS